MADSSERPELEPDTGLTEFYSSEAQSIVSQYGHIEALLGQTHDYTAPGTHCEILLRDFLRRNFPVGICVDKGFIHGRIKDGESSRHSPEIDILIHDNLRYRPTFRLEEFVIVQPEAVLGVIQVKRSLRRKKDLRKALINVANGMRHVVDSAIATDQMDLRNPGMAAHYCGNRKVFSAVVGFGNLPGKFETLVQQIQAIHAEEEFGLTKYCTYFRAWMLPQFIGSLEGCFGASWKRQPMDRGQVDFYRSNVGKKNVALQAFLWLVTHAIWSNREIHTDYSKRPRFAFPQLQELGTFRLLQPPPGSSA